MLTPMKKAALAGVVAVTALTAAAAGARADSLTFSLGDGGLSLSDYNRPAPPPPGWDRGPPPPPGWDRGPQPRGWDRGDWRRDRWARDGWDRGCTPDRAVDKAYRMGLHRPRVVDMDRRTIDVAGWQDGERVRLTFARAPRCPVLN